MSAERELRDFASLMVDEVMAAVRAQLNRGEGLSVSDQAHMLEQLVVERQRVEQAATALEKIAAEQNVYRGHGDYETAPALTAEEAQAVARAALSRGEQP